MDVFAVFLEIFNTHEIPTKFNTSLTENIGKVVCVCVCVCFMLRSCMG